MTDAVLHPSHIVTQMERLNFGDDTQPLETIEILWSKDLCMYQTEAPVAHAIGFVHRLDHIEHQAVGFITDRMNADLDLRCVGFDHHFGKWTTVEFRPSFGRNPGERSPVSTILFLGIIAIRLIKPRTRCPHDS